MFHVQCNQNLRNLVVNQVENSIILRDCARLLNSAVYKRFGHKNTKTYFSKKKSALALQIIRNNKSCYYTLKKKINHESVSYMSNFFVFRNMISPLLDLETSLKMCNKHVNKIFTNYWFSLLIDSCLPLFSNYMFFLTALPLFCLPNIFDSLHPCKWWTLAGDLFVLYRAGSKNWVALNRVVCWLLLSCGGWYHSDIIRGVTRRGAMLW